MASEKPTLKRIMSFYETFNSGSMRGAKDKVNVTPSWISRQISMLEKEIGEELVIRGGHKLLLTHKGKQLLNSVEKIIQEYETALIKLKDPSNSIEGDYILSFPSFLSSNTLYKNITYFLQRHPDLRISFKETNEAPNLLKSESDIDIRPLIRRSEGIDHKHLITCEIGLYASEDYIQRFGFLKEIGDFKDNNLIAFSEESLFPYALQNWHITTIPTCKQLILINTTTGILQAVESGLGIGPLSHVTAKKSQVPLIPVLPKVFNQTIDIYFMNSESLSENKAVSELYDYLRECPEGPLQ